MQIQVEQPKKVFSYEVEGAEHTDTSDAYLANLSLTDEQIETIKNKETHFKNRLPHFERKWRNRQLAKTDWVMVTDATHDGKALAGTYELAEARAYRQALRDYDFMNEDRPECPYWLR